MRGDLLIKSIQTVQKKCIRSLSHLDSTTSTAPTLKINGLLDIKDHLTLRDRVWASKLSSKRTDNAKLHQRIFQIEIRDLFINFRNTHLFSVPVAKTVFLEHGFIHRIAKIANSKLVTKSYADEKEMRNFLKI